MSHRMGEERRRSLESAPGGRSVGCYAPEHEGTMAGKEHRTVMGNATRALAGLAVLALATMARAKWARIVLASSATLGLARSLSAAILRLRRAAGGRWARRFRPEPDASVITKNASDRRSTREKRTYDAVDEASDQSFPGSDPPAFTATSGSCIRYG